MKAFRTAGVVSGLMAFLALSPAAHAAARVFVSVNGSDANTCSNIATPCRTLNAGIAQVDAGGEVIVVDSGSFAGANVTKSVKINVPAGVVAFSASPIAVAAGVSDVVVLRGLTIKALTPGTGTGVSFTSGAAFFIENCVVDGWFTGIEVSTAGQVFVKDTTVRNSAGNGLLALVGSGTAVLSIDRSRFERNGDAGVRIKDNSKASVRDSVASGNTFHGFAAITSSSAPAEINVLSSLAANNGGVAILASGASVIARVGYSIATNNDVGLENSDGTFESLGNNLVRGNAINTAGGITVVAGQ